MTTPTLTDEQQARLHDLRLRGMVQGAEDEITATLVEAGLARRRGAFVAPTPEGAAAAMAAARLADGSPENEAAREAYEAFLPLNTELLEVCSAWQVRPGGAPNDHSDAAYDWEVQERLLALHERISPILRRLGEVVPRFAGYRGQLQEALAKLDEGDTQWFASPRVDSYHTVWMHLHEDLLLALGIARADEQQP